MTVNICWFQTFLWEKKITDAVIFPGTAASSRPNTLTVPLNVLKQKRSLTEDFSVTQKKAPLLNKSTTDEYIHDLVQTNESFSLSGGDKLG